MVQLDTIEGLSGMAGNYHEAITMPEEHYDRSHLLRQVHLYTIMEAPSLQHYGGSKLCSLHDILTQRLQVLKVMEYELGPFIASLI